jgi:hypothetical protein
MSRIVIVILIYHRHKPTDPIKSQFDGDEERIGHWDFPFRSHYSKLTTLKASILTLYRLIRQSISGCLGNQILNQEGLLHSISSLLVMLR